MHQAGFIYKKKKLELCFPIYSLQACLNSDNCERAIFKCLHIIYHLLFFFVVLQPKWGLGRLFLRFPVRTQLDTHTSFRTPLKE